jgi:hypothetical protein
MQTTIQLLLTCGILIMTTLTAAEAQTWKDEYAARLYENPAGEKMGYRLLLPKPLEQIKGSSSLPVE